jgi:hypothetical protein
MIAWVGRRARLAIQKAIGAVRKAIDEQVDMWESVLLSSRTAVTATGPLRWVSSPGGYRLVGSYLSAQDPSEAGP